MQLPWRAACCEWYHEHAQWAECCTVSPQSTHFLLATFTGPACSFCSCTIKAIQDILGHITNYPRYSRPKATCLGTLRTLLALGSAWPSLPSTRGRRGRGWPRIKVEPKLPTRLRPGTTAPRGSIIMHGCWSQNFVKFCFKIFKIFKNSKKQFIEHFPSAVWM